MFDKIALAVAVVGVTAIAYQAQQHYHIGETPSQIAMECVQAHLPAEFEAAKEAILADQKPAPSTSCVEEIAAWKRADGDQVANDYLHRETQKLMRSAMPDVLRYAQLKALSR